VTEASDSEASVDHSIREIELLGEKKWTKKQMETAAAPRRYLQLQRNRTWIPTGGPWTAKAAFKKKIVFFFFFD
jgi:hypothetical protein